MGGESWGCVCRNFRMSPPVDHSHKVKGAKQGVDMLHARGEGRRRGGEQAGGKE